MRIVSRAAILLIFAFAPATLTAQSNPAADLATELDALREATERFRDVEVALAEGYLADPSGMCGVAAHEGLPSQLGDMGIHYFRPDLVGLTATEPRVDGNGVHTNFRNPSVLVYEPQPGGGRELVAIENIVFAEAWHAAGHQAPPSFLGHEYYYRHDNPETEVDEAHGFEPHYELHVWLYRDNPSGTFMQYNPDVRCPEETAAEREVRTAG